MPDSRAPLPAWRQAETYRPLLGADPAVWAWEFARRAGDQDEPGRPPRAANSVPELCFAGPGPAGDPLPAALWRWEADASVPVLAGRAAGRGDATAFDLAGPALATLVVRTADGAQHVLISQGARRLRLAVVAGDALAGPAVWRFQLPPAEGATGALDAVRRLIALRDTGRLAAPARSSAKAARWLEILRAHDARQAGASHRDIALALFGEARVREDWGGRSDYMRMRVQRLVRAAEQTVAGGYRALLGLRAPATDRPAVVEVWRSRAWRGAALSAFLAAGIFLGTSFSSPQTWRAARRIWGVERHTSVEPFALVAGAGPASEKSSGLGASAKASRYA